MTTDTSTNGTYGTRSAPRAIGQTGDDEAASKTTRTDETSLKNGDNGKALCVGEDGRWDDLIGAKSLTRVDKGLENLATLFTLRL